jgi:hypothetical protein
VRPEGLSKLEGREEKKKKKKKKNLSGSETHDLPACNIDFHFSFRLLCGLSMFLIHF